MKKLSLFFLLVCVFSGIVSCSGPQSSKTKDVIGKLNSPQEMWVCNYESFDLFLAVQGNYRESNTNYEFSRGWVLVPKRTADKEYSCVNIQQIAYPYPVGVNPTDPNAKTDKYGIGNGIVAFVRTENGFYTPSGYSNYAAFQNEAYSTLCIPESGTGPKLDTAARAPFVLEYPYNTSQNTLDRSCPASSQRVAALALAFKWDSSMTKPFGSGEWGDDGDGERVRVDLRDGLSTDAPPPVTYDQYGYDVNSPVPSDVRKTIREDIIPRAPIEGGNLELALKKWKGQLTPKQVLVLQTVIELGKAFNLAATQAAAEALAITQRLKDITAGAVQAVKDVAVCLAKVGAAGDYGDWYEVTIGKDFCNGSDLTLGGRAITAIGLIAGQGKFWRVVGDSLGFTTTVAKVGKRAGQLYDEFRPRFVKFSAAQAEETLSDLAKISRQKGFKETEEVDSILNGVEEVLSLSGCNPLSAMAGPSVLDRIMSAVESQAYAADCGYEVAKKFVKDEFAKNAKYRADFMNFTKKTAAEIKGSDCHHMFPQKFRDIFAKQWGIKIDDPKMLTWWESSAHRSVSKIYNERWQKFFNEFPGATKEQAIAFAKQLASEYGLTTYF